MWPDSVTVSLCSVWDVCEWLKIPSSVLTASMMGRYGGESVFLALAFPGATEPSLVKTLGPSRRHGQMVSLWCRPADGDSKSHYRPRSQLSLPNNENTPPESVLQQSMVFKLVGVYYSTGSLTLSYEVITMKIWLTNSTNYEMNSPSHSMGQIRSNTLARLNPNQLLLHFQVRSWLPLRAH